MSAERGWIGEPQPPREWQSSHYSRMADRIARFGPGILEADRRALRRSMENIGAEQVAKNTTLHEIDYSHIPSLRIADRYAGGSAPRRIPNANGDHRIAEGRDESSGHQTSTCGDGR